MEEKLVVVVDVIKTLMKVQILIFLTWLLCGSLDAQSEYQMKGNDQEVEIDFLSGYYYQDGNNGAVTGGIGTERLFDASNILMINVPLDSSKSVSLYGGVDYYTSASTDNIDDNRSSASSEDVRSYATLSYTHKFLPRGITLAGNLGFSTEYDYNSVSTGFSIGKEFNEGNSEIIFSSQIFSDQWSLIYPKELRGEVSLPTRSRISFNNQLTFAQVLSTRVQMVISAEMIYMSGLLSTPFHRVYFNDSETPDIERLPSQRIKVPIAVKVNYKPSANLAIRSSYRYYTDDFGIRAHTASIELPFEIGDAFTVSPFYRIHQQTAAKYFAPYQSHLTSETFYSSDFDLSALSSNKIGVMLQYSPLYGIGRFNIPMTKKLYLLDNMSFRASAYQRSTGLYGFSAAIGLKMKIKTNPHR
jgi:hypothetical protein